MNAEQARAEQVAHLTSLAQSSDAGEAMRARMVMGAALAFQDTVNGEIVQANGEKDSEVIANAMVILAQMAGSIADHLVLRGFSAAAAVEITLRAVGKECGRHLAEKMAAGYVPDPIGQAWPDFDFRSMMRTGEGK